MKVSKLMECLDKLKYPGDGTIRDISNWDIYLEQDARNIEELKKGGYDTHTYEVVGIPWHFVKAETVGGAYGNEKQKRIYMCLNY